MHRDLKPDNVLLAGDRVVVTDFGIARVVDASSQITKTGTIMGTPQYMAPEQLEGSKVGPAADMWALGATLYSAVEGHPAFDGPTLTAIITSVLAKDPAPPQFAGPLTFTLAQLLTKAPDARPNAIAAALALRAPGAIPGAAFQGAAFQPASPYQQGAQNPPGPVTPGPFQVTGTNPPWAYPGGPQTGVPQGFVPQGQAPQGYGPQSYGQPGFGQQGLVQQGQPGPRPARPPAAGPVLALIAAVLGIIATVLYTGLSAKYEAILWVSYLLGGGAAIAALAAGGRPAGRWLRPFTLGLWAISVAFVPDDLLSVPAYHQFSYGGRYSAAFTFSTLSDVVGATAAIVLLATLRAPRGGWAKPAALPGLLAGGTVLSWLVWQGAQLHNMQTSYNGLHNVLTQEYPTLAYAALGVVVAAFFALRAPRLADPMLGGGLLAGWAVTSFLFFLQFTLSFPYLASVSVAVNWLAAVLFVATVILAIVYARRKQPA